jgi:hypothetical protein
VFSYSGRCPEPLELLRCSKALPLAPPGTYCRTHPGRTHVSINFDSKLRHVRLVGLWATLPRERAAHALLFATSESEAAVFKKGALHRARGPGALR